MCYIIIIIICRLRVFKNGQSAAHLVPTRCEREIAHIRSCLSVHGVAKRGLVSVRSTYCETCKNSFQPSASPSALCVRVSLLWALMSPKCRSHK